MFRSGLAGGMSRIGSPIGVLATIVLLTAACGGGSTASVAAASTTTTSQAPGDSVTGVTTTPPTSAGITTTTTPIVCNFAGPTLGVDGLAESPERASVADHVSTVTIDRSAGCGRVVIELGTDFSYYSPGPAAITVPGGVVVSISDNTLRAALTGIERVDIDSVDPDLGTGAILARRPAPLADLEVVVFTDGVFTDFSARFMKNPARIVVDFSERSLAPDEVETPVASGDVIIQSITTSAVDPTIPGGSVMILGFARPFEAQMEAEVVDRYGDAVSVICSDGCYNSGIVSTRLAVPTTDWAEAWGEFEIALTDLAPGSYTARFSNDAGAIESASWLEVPLVVGR